MKCEEAIRLIHLNAEGERSLEEEALLRTHLHGCTACSAEADRVGGAEGILARLRRSTPELAEPERLTQSILRHTAAGSITGDTLTARQAIDALLSAFLHPAIRYAYAALVLFFLGLFVIQQTTMYHSIDALGEKLSRSAPPLGADVRYSVPLRQAQQIFGPSALVPLLATTPAELVDNRISIRKSEIEPWTTVFSSRLAARMITSAETPIEVLPELFLDLQKSLSLSLTLRVGGTDQ